MVREKGKRKNSKVGRSEDKIVSGKGKLMEGKGGKGRELRIKGREIEKKTTRTGKGRSLPDRGIVTRQGFLPSEQGSQRKKSEKRGA